MCSCMSYTRSICTHIYSCIQYRYKPKNVCTGIYECPKIGKKLQITKYNNELHVSSKMREPLLFKWREHYGSKVWLLNLVVNKRRTKHIKARSIFEPFVCYTYSNKRFILTQYKTSSCVS